MTKLRANQICRLKDSHLIPCLQHPTAVREQVEQAVAAPPNVADALAVVREKPLAGGLGVAGERHA